MVRRIASQVHKQVGRLLRTQYLNKEPAWFQAVLDHPPLPLPAKKSATRSSFDLPVQKKSNSNRLKPFRPRPLPIYYVEDDVRKQFFRDHPFEAFRAVSLVEAGRIADEHPVHGVAWKRLRQRGRNPSPEDAIKFTVNLYQNHSTPLTQAYAHSIAQFRSLRSEHHISSTFATLEAEHYGASFAPTEIERGFTHEMGGLKSWERREELDEGAMAARKRWKAIVEKRHGVGDQWSKGQEYVRLWKEGVRPTYAPSLTEPTSTSTGTPLQESIARNADFMQLQRLLF